jgi:hypothetical protein
MTDPVSLRLLSSLRTEGPQSPATLMESLAISQPTLSRAVRSSPETIVALGAARNRKIGALRSFRNLGSEVPVFQVSQDGTIAQIGSLIALYPNSFVFRSEADPLKPQFYPGVPFFLDDAKPQGFLGRAFTQQHPDLKLPPRPVDWSNEDILEAIARRGEDLVGNLLVGAESFARFQELSRVRIDAPHASDPGETYARYAQAAIDGDMPGSSAGGEHQKFGASLRDENNEIKRVLVKFSPAGDTFQAKRWRDLLICESIALKLLKKNEVPAAESRIIDAGGRIFLETLRFDRLGAKGRKGMLSLGALENEWTGRAQNWAVSAATLEKAKKISKADVWTIQVLESFGRLIANSDRHPGNLSFYWQPGEDHAILAPVYDMLPMLYAPTSGGEDSGKEFQLPSIDHPLLAAWKVALPMAVEYWETVKEDTRLSRAFRKIADGVLDKLRDEA